MMGSIDLGSPCESGMSRESLPTTCVPRNAGIGAGRVLVKVFDKRVVVVDLSDGLHSQYHHSQGKDPQ